MKDVALRAGVSTRTVSNVVSGYAHVSPGTRAKVQRALDEMGYALNTAARSLKSGRTGMVALVLPHLHSSYFAELADAVVRAADRRGVTVLIEVTGGTLDREMQVLTSGLAHLSDGVLFSPLSLTPRPELMSRSGFPLVLLGESGLDAAFDHVGIDNVAASRVAVEHLLAGGRRRIVALGLDDNRPASPLRHQGYLLAHRNYGQPPMPGIRATGWERQAGADAVEKLLRCHDADRVAPDALFAFNDTLALGALRALLHHGVRVPQDVAVVSIDDINEAAFATPSLTSIAPDLDTLAEQALGLLESRIADNGRPTCQLWTPFDLAVRESSGPVRSSLQAGTRDALDDAALEEKEQNHQG